jgi:hypothetical protein
MTVVSKAYDEPNSAEKLPASLSSGAPGTCGIVPPGLQSDRTAVREDGIGR